MSHQEALTIIAKIRDGQVAPLKMLLGSIREHEKNGAWSVIPFAKLPRVHFARFMVFDATHDLDGNPLPPQLALLTNVDAPLDEHLHELATVCANGIDAVFGHCEDYPATRSPEARVQFLRQHACKSDAVHVNRRGRTVEQIRQEETLRREIGKFLDAGNFDGLSPVALKERIIAFVRGRADLAWALQLPAPPSLCWRVKEQAHKYFSLLLVLLFSPLILLGLPLFLYLLRRHEKRDKPDTSSASSASARAFRDDEDFWAHNQVVAAGLFKPGLFRKFVARTILAMTDFATRHIYNRGILSGLNTIHFARWVTLDDGRRLFFSSNYDGSLESYMNDFIDKAAWGLNAIFSSGDGFPRTAFLFCGGITDEKAYKRFLPTRQVQTNVWYSAYPHLTTKNIANNEAIRHGLSEQMNDAQTRLWLKRFGSGNQLPESGWVARKLDSLQWEKICRNCK